MKITLVVGALLLVVACGDSAAESERPTLPQWAAGVCEAAESLVDSAADDGVDPTTLSLEDRLARAERLNDEWIASLTAAADALRAVGAAEGTTEFHDALVRQLEDVARSLQEQDMGAADSPAALEAMNAELNIVIERTDRDVAAAADSLPDDAVAALRGITRCGLVVT